MCQVWSSIQGPWAFIYWESSSRRLWFGRDIFGRRSLVWMKQNCHMCALMKISSVADLDENIWEEVPGDGIYFLEVDSQSNGIHPKCYRWSHTPSGIPTHLKEAEDAHPVTNIKTVVSTLHEPLNMVLPATENLADLYGMTVESSDIKRDPRDVLVSFGSSAALRRAVETFVEVMENAVKIRTDNQPHLCKDCVKSMLNCESESHPVLCPHSSVAILYSGGVDSIFLAAIADRFVPINQPIDLLNVSFEHKLKGNSRRRNKKSCEEEWTTFDSPDRQTGRDGLQSLTSISPSRTWNFVEINVSAEELQKERRNCIHNLILPANTVLDDSIGCAVWFAARGRGFLNNTEGHAKSYCSPARVVLVGMGADEQLAGYSRHRAKFSCSGWSGLIEEVAMEIDRISCRNLGRDDRIISDHGREGRFPFLDENLVRYLKSLPMWLKANLHMPRGVGEKLLLRLAASSIGLTNAAVLPKRAVQFGSRIAHSEERKEKGSDVCSRLKTVTLGLQTDGGINLIA